MSRSVLLNYVEFIPTENRTYRVISFIKVKYFLRSFDYVGTNWKFMFWGFCKG